MTSINRPTAHKWNFQAADADPSVTKGTFCQMFTETHEMGSLNGLRNLIYLGHPLGPGRINLGNGLIVLWLHLSMLLLFYRDE